MDAASSAADWDVGGQLRVLLRRWRLIAVVVVLVVAAALVVSLTQEPVFQGRVEVLLQRPESETIFEVNPDDSNAQARRVETEMEVIKSEPVRAAVRRELGPVPKPGVSQVGSSDIVRVSAKSATRTRAAAVAVAYVDTYIEYRRSRAVVDLEQAARKIQARINDLERQLTSLAEDDTSTSGARDQLTTQLALYRQRLGDLRVDADLRTGGAQRVTQGRIPTRQVQPAPVRAGILASFIGLLLGVGLAWLRERLDESVKGKEDVERILGGVPSLALIPAVDSWRDRSSPVLVSVQDAGSPAAEAYRSLRTSLQFVGAERAPRVVQVTSANAGEGKTTTLCNLSVAMARAGRRVVVVDCDLRRSRVHEFFGIPNEVGFSSVFLGDAGIEDAVVPVPEVEGLSVLPAGHQPPNPSELLASRRTAEVFFALQEAYDVVLIDSPPVLPVTDATVLSSWVEATVLVVVPGSTTRRELHRAAELLRQVGAPLVGAVINETRRGAGYPSNYYAYGYKASDVGSGELRGRGAKRSARRDAREAPAADTLSEGERAGSAGISDS